MRIVITGGAGFLGRRLAHAIVARGHLTDATGAHRPVREVVLVDVVAAGGFADPRVRVVSGEAEADFDLGWRVNVDATRLLLERCRALARPPRVVFASSVAVFGGALPDVVPDTQVLAPQSSYGAQKAVGELFVHDYTRKGFLDGRSLRLPTVSVRPGKPNRAASSFASGILREPLAGVEATCPVPADTRMWLLSPRRVIDNLLLGHEVPAAALTQGRSVNVPGISVTVAGMLDALRRVAGDAVAARVRFAPDPAVERIVRTWPRDFEAAYGRALGMQADADFDAIVRQYIDDELRK